MAIEIYSTDTEYTDSPDTGWPECTCSRCGKMIKEREVPLRCFDSDKNTEYRYCESCMINTMGIIMGSRDDDDWENPDIYDMPFIP